MGGNYSKGLYKQLAEQIEQTEKLQKENNVLKAEINRLKNENRRLREKISCLESSMSEKIAEAIAHGLALATAPILDELAKANTEIARLKAIINKDSTNSSKPPSTNGFKDIPNNRERSGKPQGGQKGHPGHRLSLPENIEELEQKGILERRLIDHTGGSKEYISRYTIDVETRVVITEHRYSQETALPEALYNEVSYGDEIKSTVVLLMNEGIVAEKRLSEIISGLTHGVVNLSTGTIDKIQRDFSENLIKNGEIEAIKQDLLGGEVINTDDTTMRVQERIIYPEDEKSGESPVYERAEKKSFKATVRTHSNERSTIYTVNPKKDKKGIERDGILPIYRGKLCHDHESKFYNYGSDNGTCGGHISRELKGLHDLYNCSWAEKMRIFINGMNEYKKSDQSSGVLFCDVQKLSSFEDEYDQILGEGREIIGKMKKGDFGYAEFNLILERLTAYKDNYMLFMRDYKVPFTNNLAERDLRSEKTKQKVSGLFRSWDGIVDHVNIRSFISTVKKRSLDLVCAIRSVIKGESVFTR